MKTPTSKTTLSFVALALVAAMFTPTVSADPFGSISRTFPTPDTGFRIEWKGDGTGIYDPADPDNICIVSILGLQTVSGFYYDQLRKHTNGNQFVLQTAVNAGTVGPIDCPDIFETTPKGANKEAVIEDANVYSGSWILMDTILCSKKNSSFTCIPDVPAEWDLYACPANKPATDFTFVNDGKSIFDPLNDLGALTGSRSVNACPVIHSHDVSEKVVEYGANFVSSGFEGVPVEHVCHVGMGPCVVVSCVTVGVSQYDDLFQLVGSGTAVSHDWFLALDVGANPVDNANAVLWFEGVGAQGQLEKGLYDLGGQNGCPLPDATEPQDDKKDKDEALVVIP